MYLLSDAFAVPALLLRIVLAYRVRQCAVEDARPDDARQEVTQLHVQFCVLAGAIAEVREAVAAECEEAAAAAVRQ